MWLQVEITMTTRQQLDEEMEKIKTRCDILVYATPEGNFLSPKAVERAVDAAKAQGRSEAYDEVLKLSCTHTMDGLCFEIIDKRK